MSMNLCAERSLKIVKMNWIVTRVTHLPRDKWYSQREQRTARRLFSQWRERCGVTSFFTPLVPPTIIYSCSRRVSFTFTLPLPHTHLVWAAETKEKRPSPIITRSVTLPSHSAEEAHAFGGLLFFKGYILCVLRRIIKFQPSCVIYRNLCHKARAYFFVSFHSCSVRREEVENGMPRNPAFFFNWIYLTFGRRARFAPWCGCWCY